MSETKNNETHSVADSGLGWAWDGENRNLDLYFEVAGAGVDSNGNACPAGARVRFESCEIRISNDEIQACILATEKRGLNGLPAKAIAMKEYEEKYATAD